MKRFFRLFTLVLLLLLQITIVYAMPPIRKPPYERNPFRGMIPLSENNLEVKSREYQIDLLNADNLVLDYNLERQAQVTLSYEIFNSGDLEQIDFCLPLFSKYNYLTNNFRVKVNDQEIPSRLAFSRWESTDDLTADQYKQMALSEYYFQNDVDGYLYTMVAPKARTNRYSYRSELTFYDIPENTIIIDMPGYGCRLLDRTLELFDQGPRYEGEEVDYFFVSEDLEVKLDYKEFYRENYSYAETGEIYTNQPITKEPMRLTDYLKRFHLDHITFYKDDVEVLLQKHLDEYLGLKFNFDLNHVSRREMLTTYQTMALVFKVDFEPGTTTKVEVTYDVPISVLTFPKDRNTYLEFEFVNQYDSLWGNVSNAEVTIITDEKMSNSTLNYNEENNKYLFVLDTNKNIEVVTFINSEYRFSSCFLLSRSLPIWYYGLFVMIPLILYRRKKG
ncbi:MAG: hypothetical protein ACOX40_06975 [Bacilli bacterium]|jgi:hypothetical protein